MTHTEALKRALAELVALEADGKHADEFAIEAWERARAALAAPSVPSVPSGEPFGYVLTNNVPDSSPYRHLFYKPDQINTAYKDNALHVVPVYAAPQPAPAGWRPIETAPQRGRFLAVVDGAVRVVAWGKTSHVPFYGFCLADQGAEDFDLCQPTLWMPLPAAPTAPGA